MKPDIVLLIKNTEITGTWREVGKEGGREEGWKGGGKTRIYDR
jgi:hypothetical protein